jgi:hypothetical protein
MVVTNVGGVAEAVADAGVVVAPRDHVAVAQACVQLLRDDGLRRTMGQTARSRMLEMFTLTHSLEAYRQVYGHLTSGLPAGLPAGLPTARPGGLATARPAGAPGSSYPIIRAPRARGRVRVGVGVGVSEGR